MQKLFENWREFRKEALNENEQSRGDYEQMINILAVLMKFKGTLSQSIFEGGMRARAEGVYYWCEKSPYSGNCYTVLKDFGFSEEQVDSFFRDMKSAYDEMIEAKLESYQEANLIFQKYGIPGEIRLSAMAAKNIIKSISSLPLDTGRPLFRGMKIPKFLGDPKDNEELILHIQDNVDPLSRDDDRFVSFTFSLDSAQKFSGLGSEGPAAVPNAPTRSGIQAGTSVILVLENPKFGFDFKQSGGEKEVLIPFWNFKRPLKDNISVVSHSQDNSQGWVYVNITQEAGGAITTAAGTKSKILDKKDVLDDLMKIDNHNELAIYIVNNYEETIAYIIEQLLPGGKLTGALQLLDNEKWRLDTSKTIYKLLRREITAAIEIIKKLLAGDVAGAQALFMQLLAREIGGWLEKEWDSAIESTPEEDAARATRLSAQHSRSRLNENKLIISIKK
jgi:hypothetical protein